METDDGRVNGVEGERDQKGREERRGRKPALDAEDHEALRKRVTEEPGVRMAELVKLIGARGKKVSGTTIGKGLKAMGFARAKRQKAPSVPAPQTPPRYGPQHRREPTATKYPSSLTDSEWAVMGPLLQAVRDPRGRKPTHPIREMVDAIFYLVRSGCQWRLLPKEFPPWTAVWSVFRRLRDSGTLERLYDALFALWRKAANRGAEPTAGIVDSQTVKTTEKGGPQDTTQARRPRVARGTWSPT